MASLIYLDTHVAVWLYLPRLDLLSARARQAIDTEELRVSPMVELELEFLRDVGRLTVGGEDVLHSLHAQLGLSLCDLAFPRVARAAVEHGWTRNPFDRVIVGHADAASSELITRDETIRENYERAVW